MKEEIRKCDFCNKVIRDDDTYNHGDCIENLKYDLFTNIDYIETYVPEDKATFDICSECLSELRNLIWTNTKFKKLFSTIRYDGI